MKLKSAIELIKSINKTPLFIYSKRKIIKNLKTYNNNFDKVFYAIKANYNRNVIKIMKENKSGFEVVSIRELKMLLNLGICKKKIIFSGVCKTKEDIKFILSKNIGFINVDSLKELKIIKKIRKNINTRLILKFNLNIKFKTKKEIKTCSLDSKFGICKNEINKIRRICKKRNVKIDGFGFHLGSQINNYKPYVKGFKEITKIIKRTGIKVRYINIGGGIAIDYKKGRNNLSKLIKKIKKHIKEKNIKIMVEPGRSIVGNSCITLSKIVRIKKTPKKRFAVIDIGMESIIRPSLYKSKHRVTTLKKRGEMKRYDVVGPICESTDIFIESKLLSIKEGDFLLIHDTGAYCMSMRMDYNMRKVPKEIII
ncbi:diaminopimelate decarboxylase [Candidatus Vidania fulgoroideorum]